MVSLDKFNQYVAEYINPYFREMKIRILRDEEKIIKTYSESKLEIIFSSYSSKSAVYNG